MSYSATATQSTDPKIVALRGWCDDVEDLLGNSKAKRSELATLKGKLTGLVGDAPVELTGVEDAELATAPDKIVIAQNPGPGNLAPTHRTGARAAVEQVRASTEKAALRAQALGKIDTARLAFLTPQGLLALRELDDPEKAVAASEALEKRIKGIETRAKEIDAYLNDVVRASPKACRDALAALTLSEAESSVEAYEHAIAGLEAERKGVEAMMESFKKSPLPGGMPTSLADQRTLYEMAGRRKAIQADRKQVEADARAIADKLTGVPNPKAQQMDDLLPRLDAAIKNWPTLDLKIMLSGRADDPGTVAWMESLVDRLRGPVGMSAEDARQAREKQEWTKFEDEVKAFWTEFKDSGYAPSKRGPFGSASTLTPYVRAQIRARDSVSIDGRTYRKAGSDTTGVSLHADYPKPQGGYPLNLAGQEIRSFIYHL